MDAVGEGIETNVFPKESGMDRMWFECQDDGIGTESGKKQTRISYVPSEIDNPLYRAWF